MYIYYIYIYKLHTNPINDYRHIKITVVMQNGDGCMAAVCVQASPESSSPFTATMLPSHFEEAFWANQRKIIGQWRFNGI